jgi:hypothetical protein
MSYAVGYFVYKRAPGARKGIVKLTGGFLNRTKPYDKSQTIRDL